jgi:polyferredoxin
MEKFGRLYLKKIRYAFQWGLLCFVLYEGYRFYLFVGHFLSGNGQPLKRPPSVDGFLPIGGLMGLKIWLTTGFFDTIHPSAIVILISAVVVSLIFKKSFCGYICPVGTLSEAAYKIGRRLLGKNLRLPAFIDYPLRSIKYILMAFFFYIVFINMSVPALKGFLYEPYWKVADVKMLRFFTNMTQLTFYVLSGLFIFSLFYKNFWCRYLCPYGAMLGLLSLLSPFKITRDNDKCIHCMRCTDNCPQLLPVESKQKVRSPECTGCLTCVSVCPQKGALDILTPGVKKTNPALYIVLVALSFFAIIWAGKITGHWESSVTYEEYKTLIPQAGALEHP